MARHTAKPAAPTDEDWKHVIEVFKRNRDLDRKEFRELLEKLPEELTRKSEDADDTATRMWRNHDVKLSDHDGVAVILSLERKGYAEQLGIAALELLPLDPIHPWLDKADPFNLMPIQPTSTVIFGKPDEETIARQMKDAQESQRWGLDLFAKPTRQRPIALLRLQAERLVEGVKRVQHCLDDHERWRDAIAPATSVALHQLFTAVEPWNVKTTEIAKRLVDARVEAGHPSGRRDALPRALSTRERNVQVKRWYASLRQRREQWRKRMKSRDKPNVRNE